MKKRILTNTYRKQFVIIPTFGIIRWTENYRFRIGLMWGIWQMSIGVLREAETCTNWQWRGPKEE